MEIERYIIIFKNDKSEDDHKMDNAQFLSIYKQQKLYYRKILIIKVICLKIVNIYQK